MYFYRRKFVLLHFVNLILIIMSTTVSSGIFHVVTEDIIDVLSKDSEILERWNNLTPIQRNEWICWVTIVKKEETRTKHLKRMMSDLKGGKKQPCCWPGCPHRRPEAKKWFPDLKKEVPD